MVPSDLVVFYRQLVYYKHARESKMYSAIGFKPARKFKTKILP